MPSNRNHIYVLQANQNRLNLSTSDNKKIPGSFNIKDYLTSKPEKNVATTSSALHHTGYESPNKNMAQLISSYPVSNNHFRYVHNTQINTKYVPEDLMSNQEKHYSYEQNNVNAVNTFVLPPPPLYYRPPVDEDSNQFFDEYESYGLSLPASFNPRATKNMPSIEKVTRWMDTIPIYQIAEDTWETDCYSTEENFNWEEEEFDEALLKRIYDIGDFVYMCSLATPEEIINFQCKRWDSLIKKMYLSEDLN